MNSRIAYQKPVFLTPWRTLWMILALIGACHVGSASAQEAEPPLDKELNEKVFKVLVGGEGQHIYLEVTLFKPDGPGPFPLAVLNHGKDPIDPHLQPRYRSVYAARYFVSRGYAVILPMMRGFAGSGGTSWVSRCSIENAAAMHAIETAQVLDYMKTQKDLGTQIDPNKIVIFGQSMGGLNTLALGAINYPGVKGLVNFAGGLNTKGCKHWERSLPQLVGGFGAKTVVPSIWFYGDNDKLFAEPVWQDMFDQYTANGGLAQIVAYGKFGEDSHTFLGRVEALSIWVPRVDEFLASVGLPSKAVRAELLPESYPPPSGFAAIDDVGAIPFINDKGRETYREFLKKPMPRVFLIARNGSSIAAAEGFDPLGRAKKLCRDNGFTCEAYAVDDQVVWKKQ